MNTVTGTKILGITAFAATLAVLTASANANADTTMKWCTTWKSTYVDAGFGEDFFTSSSPSYRAAQYTRVQVTIYNTSEVIWDGLLDSSGCTPDLPALSNTKYRIWQWTQVERGTRMVFVIPDPPWAPANTWPEGSVGIYWDFTTGWFQPDQHATYTKSLNWESPKANVMPIAGRVLGHYNTLAYPTGTKTFVRTDSATCATSGGAWTDGSHICVEGDNPTWEDVTTWKYIVGHEFGHRIANVNGWTAVGGYLEKDVDWPGLCSCNHVSYGSQWHCLQSRELGKHGEQEGFGHFIATALYNSRVENDGKYVYCKESWMGDGESFTPYPPPRVLNAYQVTPENYYDRWMEKYCSSFVEEQDGDPVGMANRGVESDWLHFFYEMWTTGTYKFEAAELLNVWDETGSPYLWDDLVDTVGVEYGNPSNERSLFISKGDQTGVNH
jgi:hypothetical protein